MARSSWLGTRGKLSLLAAVALALPVNPVAAATVGQFPPSSAEGTSSNIAMDTAGIPLVTGVVQPRPKSEEEAQAISDAQVFAESHQADVGYPWLDRDTGTVELSAASQEGRTLLDGERAALRSVGMNANVSIRDVAFSMAELIAISDDVTTLQQQAVPDADLIYSTAPDFQNSRIVIRVSAASTTLFAELARRYGTEAIALWIDPKGRGGSTLRSRDADVSPYWGGAKIGTPSYSCSDAFSWTIGATNGNALITAAHCIPAGGGVKIGTSSTIRGTVAVSSEENWSPTNGTTYYSGQSTYRGDVALIRLYSSVSSAAKIYRGGPTSSSSSTVVTRLGRYSYLDENVFVGGMRTGETGPYHVNMVNVNWWYSQDGPNVVIKNATIAYILSGPFIAQGDSGGSVFRENASGNIIAVGVLSGFAGDSSAVFTDLYHTYLALPGDVNY